MAGAEGRWVERRGEDEGDVEEDEDAEHLCALQEEAVSSESATAEAAIVVVSKWENLAWNCFFNSSNSVRMFSNVLNLDISSLICVRPSDSSDSDTCGLLKYFLRSFVILAYDFRYLYRIKATSELSWRYFKASHLPSMAEMLFGRSSLARDRDSRRGSSFL